MQKIGKIFGIIFLGLVLLVGIPGYYFIKNFDLNKYKSYASQIVEEQLGRSFRINGEASIGISLVPTLVLEDVELANPSWAVQPQMVKVKRLELKFALLPLLKKQVVVDKAILINPEIYLEVAKDGAASWDFPALKEVSAAAYENSGWLIKSAAAAEPEDQLKEKLKAFAGYSAQNVIIENGIVNYANQQDGSQINLEINNITLSVPGIDEQITLNADVFYNGQDIKIESVLGSVNNLLENGKPYPVLAKGNAYGVGLDLNGSLVNIFSNLQYAAQVNIYNPAGNFNAPETTLKTRIDGDLKSVAADIQSLNIVNNVITGTINADISNKLPFVKADLKSAKIDLTSLNAAMSPTAYGLSFVKSANAADSVPNTPIPYADLKKANAQVQLAIGELIIDSGMQAHDVLFKADLNNGILNVKPLQFKFGGGEIDALAAVNANAQSVSLSLSSKNMLLQNLHKDFEVTGKGDFGVLSGGNVDLYVNLLGSGATYRQLVNGLRGQTAAVVNKSEIKIGSLNFLTGNFISEILNVLNLNSSKVSKLDLHCAVVRADFVNGKAVFPKGIVLSSEQLGIVSDGSVNLENEKLNFTIQPFAGKLADTNLAQTLTSFFKVSGTVQKPKIVIDSKETLSAVLGIAATGGTAYLGSKIVMDSASSPCYTALTGTPYADMFPKPTGVVQTTKDVYKDTTKELKNDLKSLKNSAKDFLGVLGGKEKR